MFITLLLNRSNVVSATATGHASEVVNEFHEICQILLGGRGAWRITKVEGIIKASEPLDSKMTWSLKAQLKSQ